MKIFFTKKQVLILEGVLFVAIIIALFTVYSQGAGLRKSMDTNLPAESIQTIKNRIKSNQSKLEVSERQFVPEHMLYEITTEIAFNYHLLGDLASAEEFYLRASKINSKDPAVWASLFTVYRDMFDYKAARKAVQRSLEINGADWNLWRGYIELERFHFDADKNELDSLYREALQKTNDSINIITVYAKFLEENGRIDEAIYFWEKAVMKVPDNELYKAELSRLQQLKSL